VTSIPAILVISCILALVVNEFVRIKYGFISNKHFVLFWLIWISVIALMGIALGLLLNDIVH
jgi:hypothetical protein